LREFVNSRSPQFARKHPGAVTQKQILEAVVDETLYGMIKVDLECPTTWDEVKYRPPTTSTPWEYFAEMSPIFCTTEIPFDLIGRHMQTHVEKHNLSTKNSKLLVGGMRGQLLLIVTRLLRWYVLHGLKVKVVHDVVEFSKHRCLKDFGDKITAARRLGDVDKSMAVRALIQKLIGNSSSVGTILNKENYSRIRYVNGPRKAQQAVNDPRFKSRADLNGEIFEIDSEQRASP
jgi:hypothetical protein